MDRVICNTPAVSLRAKLTLVIGAEPDSSNVIGVFRERQMAQMVGDLLLAFDRGGGIPTYSHFTVEDIA